jgi:hypothetical protein
VKLALPVKLVLLAPAVVQEVLVPLVRLAHLALPVSPVLADTKVIRETVEMVVKTDKKDLPVPKVPAVLPESVVYPVFPENEENPVDVVKTENAVLKDLPVKLVLWVDVVLSDPVVPAVNPVIPVLWE